MTVALLLAALLTQTPADPPPAPVEDPASAPAPARGSSAPEDDYGYVAWCRGALSGHMDLSRQAAPEMARVRAEKAAKALAGKSGAEAARIKAALAKEAKRDDELDAEQLKAGRDYLALYGRALHAAEEAGAPRNRGAEATGQGYRIWSAARASDDKTRMYSYLMWELPGRCETSAKKLEEQSSLLGAAFKQAQVSPDDNAAPAPPPAADPAAPPADATSPPEAPPAPPLRTPSPPPGA